MGLVKLGPEHAALLRVLAKSHKDKALVGAYSDYLQELGNPGWLIVRHYPPVTWPVWVAPHYRSAAWAMKWREKGRSSTQKSSGEEMWGLPWLRGIHRSFKHTDRGDYRLRWTLLAYAEGDVVDA